MDNISITRGETLNLEIESDDLLAQQVTLNVAKKNEAAVITVSASFQAVDGKSKPVALLRVEASESEVVPSGEYLYQLTVTTAGGDVEKYPDSDCDDDCDLPTFTILPALDIPEN